MSEYESFQVGQYVQYGTEKCMGHDYGNPLYGIIVDITYSVRTTEGNDVNVSHSELDMFDPLDKQTELHAKGEFLLHLERKAEQLRTDAEVAEFACIRMRESMK